MKAVLALIVLYVGTFFIAIGNPTQRTQAAKPGAAALQDQQAKSPAPPAIDPQKEADIRSLIELTGASDLIQDAMQKSSSQYTQRIEILLPDKDRAQKLSAAFLDRYKARFTTEAMDNQLVRLYDKHFTHDEIRQLLQFYGSPLGQKFAEEMPKLTQEAQAAGQELSQQAAKEAWQDLRTQNPDLAAAHRMARRAER